MRLAYKALILLVFLAVLFVPAEAKAGCCSYHGGVDCSAGPQENGHVFCNDDWLDSSCLYSEIVACEEHVDELPIIDITPEPDVISEPNSTPEVPEAEPTPEEPISEPVPDELELPPEESELPLEEPITDPVPDEPEIFDCGPAGRRGTIDEKPVYCEEGFWAEQKGDSQACENNFECRTNFCSKNQCYDISSQVEENTSILQAILEFIFSIFG